MSLPMATAVWPAATAEAEPPDEPPGTRSASHGFRVTCATIRHDDVLNDSIISHLRAPAPRSRLTLLESLQHDRNDAWMGVATSSAWHMGWNVQNLASRSFRVSSAASRAHPKVRVFGGGAHPEAVHVRLPDQDRARGPQPRHRGGVVRGHVPAEHPRARGRL